MNQKTISDVLIYGKGRSASSIAACLTLSGSSVTLISQDSEQDTLRVQQHLQDYRKFYGTELSGLVQVLDKPTKDNLPSLVIITGYTDKTIIHSIVQQVEMPNANDLIIAIATDHIPLSDLQENAARPENIVVVNWAEPAHTTFFMEIVHNDTTDLSVVDFLKKICKDHWGKDPYTVHADIGIRGRMMTAMVREAMYLIDKGYANVKDIDRACRNDAGTYMPFAGNFQYMDLMGTYAYGIVMEELNKELSNTTEIPAFFDQVLSSDKNETTLKKRFYTNPEYEEEECDNRMRNFSFEIRELIKKYPGSE